MSPVVSTPDSIQEFSKRMVACNIQNSLKPLGDETLDRSIQKFAVAVLRDWLPRFRDQSNLKAVGKLCFLIKKFFKDDPAQDKVNAVAAQIEITCKSAWCGRREGWMELPMKEYGLDVAPKDRLDAILTRRRSKEDQLVCCQWVMSMVLHECERMHVIRKVYVLQYEIERQRNELFNEQTNFTFKEGEMTISLDFPSDHVGNFDEFCFWLNFNQIVKSFNKIEKILLQSMDSQDKIQMRICFERFQDHMTKIREAIAALSELNPALKRAGEDLLAALEGKLYKAAISCLKQTDAAQPIRFCTAPECLQPQVLWNEIAKYLDLHAKNLLAMHEAANLYFAHFDTAKSFYEVCREKRDSLVGTRDPKKYNFSRIQNTASRTLPETLELEPWVGQERRAVIVRDQLIAPYLKAEASAPSPEAPILSKKNAVKPRSKEKPRPLQPSTTEEKLQLDEESPLCLPPQDEKRASPWAPIRKAPILERRPLAPPVQFEYDARVDRWFSEELNPEDFPEYDGNPTARDVSYHAFPLEVDNYTGDALEQVWINTTSGLPDRQLVIPAEIEPQGSAPVRGVISYAIGQDGVCYHRCFHPMKTVDLVEKFGMGRFEKADFPELVSGKPASGRGGKPKRAKKVQENPALGTVTFQDERSGSIVRIFRG